MTTEKVAIDPEVLERKINQIAASSLDPDAAERLAGIAQMLLASLQDYHRRTHDAWVLIGRCDMALELIEFARDQRGARLQAREMRAEIKKASGR